MKKLIARILANISSPKKDLRKVESRLISLKEQLEEIKEMPNKVEAIVKLFQVISSIQDENDFNYLIQKLNKRNYRKSGKALKTFEIVLMQLERAGRRPGGMNRTKKGEVVTSSNVFLGDVHGIWTKPASYWLENQEKLENEDSGTFPSGGFLSVWFLIDYQARNFVESHTNEILDSISNFRNAF